MKSRRVCESSIFFFFVPFCFVFLLCIFQASRSKRSVSAKDEKEVIPALSPVLKSIVQGAMFISKRKLSNAECIDQIKRGISLAKAYLPYFSRTMNSSLLRHLA